MHTRKAPTHSLNGTCALDAPAIWSVRRHVSSLANTVAAYARGVSPQVCARTRTSAHPTPPSPPRRVSSSDGVGNPRKHHLSSPPLPDVSGCVGVGRHLVRRPSGACAGPAKQATHRCQRPTVTGAAAGSVGMGGGRGWLALVGRWRRQLSAAAAAATPDSGPEETRGKGQRAHPVSLTLTKTRTRASCSSTARG
jgi:hypothetical protein